MRKPLREVEVSITVERPRIRWVASWVSPRDGQPRSRRAFTRDTALLYAKGAIEVGARLWREDARGSEKVTVLVPVEGGEDE